MPLASCQLRLLGRSGRTTSIPSSVNRASAPLLTSHDPATWEHSHSTVNQDGKQTTPKKKTFMTDREDLTGLFHDEMGKTAQRGEAKARSTKYQQLSRVINETLDLHFVWEPTAGHPSTAEAAHLPRPSHLWPRSRPVV